MTEANPSPAPRARWWKNPWLIGLLILGLLHATGMAVHVQAGLQRVLLATGVFRPDLIPEDQRIPADLGFQVADAEGRVLNVADMGSEVIFINFWASWCAPCLAEMPAIDRLHRDYADRARFLIISLDADPETARAYLENKRYSLETVVPASRIPDSMNSGAIPTTVVVDRQGRQAVYETGMSNYDSRRFRLLLESLLEE